MLPVLCAALLAIGAVQAKDKNKKKSAAETVAGQIESSKKAEPTRKVEVPSRSESSGREESPRREEPPKRVDPPRREDPPKSEPKLMSKARIKEQAEKRYQARVVRQIQGESGGRPVYMIRLLTDNDHVLNIVVDAETGKELK
jgi:uncharacterized membrane protein YkoI